MLFITLTCNHDEFCKDPITVNINGIAAIEVGEKVGARVRMLVNYRDTDGGLISLCYWVRETPAEINKMAAAVKEGFVENFGEEPEC